MKKKSFFVTVVLNNAIWISGAKGIYGVYNEDKYIEQLGQNGTTALIVVGMLVAYRIYCRIFWRYFD